METAPQNATPARDWRQPLSLGLAIGLALPASRTVASALEPTLGSGWAFAVSLAAAGAVGGIVALAVCWLLKPSGGRPA